MAFGIFFFFCEERQINYFFVSLILSTCSDHSIPQSSGILSVLQREELFACAIKQNDG